MRCLTMANKEDDMPKVKLSEQTKAWRKTKAAEWDAMSGLDQIRYADRLFSATNMSYLVDNKTMLDDLDAAQLLCVAKACLISEYDYYPDQWTTEMRGRACSPVRYDQVDDIMPERMKS